MSVNRKRPLSGQLTGEPPAKRLNILGTPNHTSTPHLASKGTPKSTPKNVNTPDSGLPSSYGSKLSNSAVVGNSPNLKPSVNKRRLSIGTPQQTLLKCILKPGGMANQTPKSAASKSMNLSNGRLQLPASASKGNASVNGSPQVSHNRSVSFAPEPDFIESLLKEFNSHPVTPEKLKDLLSCILLNKGPGLILALEKLKENLDKLQSNHTGLIEEIASLPWAHRESDVSKAFQHFFISLLLHHPFYNKIVIISMLKQLNVPKPKADENTSEIVLTVPSNINPQKNIRSFLRVLLRTLPSERKEILKQMEANFPFYKGALEKFLNYLKGILGMYDYFGDAGGDILEIAFEHVIELDASILKHQLQSYGLQVRKEAAKPAVEASKDDSSDNEAQDNNSAGEEAVDDSSDSDDSSDQESDEEEEPVTPLSARDYMQCNKMDDCMTVLFNFIRDKCYVMQEVEPTKGKDGFEEEAITDKKPVLEDDIEKVVKNKVAVFSPEKAEPIVKIMMKLFTTHLLTSHKLNNLQYIIFYLFNQNKTYAKEFISLTWEAFKCVNHASIIRQAAISHFSGFLCRSLEIGYKTLCKRLKQLVNWIHDYMNRDSSSACDYMAVNLDIHGPFYSACQAVFYIIAFRHTDLAQNDDLTVIRELDLTSIISHPLNPLRVVNKAVLKMFSKVMAHYQIVYCNNIIKRNQRITLPVIGLSSDGAGGINSKALLLDDHFPYDPYLLPQTDHLIQPLYRKFEGLKDCASDTDYDAEDGDDNESLDGDKKSDSSYTPSRQRNNSVGSRRSRTISVTELISRELDII